MNHIVALDREVLAASLVRSRLGDMDLVIWRGASGTVHVWEDNCPHRSVRLSAGRNMGTYLEDIYHGWRFGEDGSVIHVPAENGKACPEVVVNKLNSYVLGEFVWASEGKVVAEELTGEPCKPVHFLVPDAKVRRQLDKRMHVTPWGADACVVYSASDDPHGVHHKLTVLRRRLEGSA